MATWLAAGWRFTKDRTKEQWLGIVALATALSYALLYFGYFQFYAVFGLHPAEVGLDKLHLLQQSLLGPLILPIFLILHAEENPIALLPLILIFFLVVDAFVYCRSRRLDRKATIRELCATALLGVVVGWVVLLASGYYDLVTTSQSMGVEVRKHGMLFPSLVYQGKGLMVPFLDAQAVAVDVTFTSKDAYQPKLSSGCVIYLGSSDGIAILYDFTTKEVARVNVKDVDLVTHPYYRYLPKDCMLRSG
jgi:hypothetical protein